MRPPEATEYAEYYASYVGRVSGRPVLDVLSEAPASLDDLLVDVTGEQETFAYAEGKWTIREVIGHVIDTERVLAYRALHIARGDPAELPGMDQDVWLAGSDARDRRLVHQLEEFRALRAANVRMFSSFDEKTVLREGIASGVGFTVRALVYIIAGHELHHRGVLADRYLGGGVRDFGSARRS